MTTNDVSGLIDYVTFHPGRSGQIELQVRGSPYPARWFLDAGGKVTWNGNEILDSAYGQKTLVILLGFLAAVKGKVQVTLHPDPNRYGGSIDAEFVETDK